LHAGKTYEARKELDGFNGICNDFVSVAAYTMKRKTRTVSIMENSRHWRLKAQRYRLEGSTCLTCGQVMFPPRPVCPRCTGQLTETAGKALAMVLISTNATDIESPNKYRFMERMIR
jgi:rubredoxin-like zinc ribbon protein